VVDKVTLGQVLSKYFGFPCQFSFHQMLPTHVSSGAGTIRQLAPDITNGLNVTPLHEIKEEIYTYIYAFHCPGIVRWIMYLHPLEKQSNIIIFSSGF
jgi:hypothetical protein